MSPGVELIFIEQYFNQHNASIIVSLSLASFLYFLAMTRVLAPGDSVRKFGLACIILGNFLPLLLSNLIMEYSFYLGIILGMIGAICFLFSQATPWRKFSVTLAGCLPLITFVLLMNDLDNWFMLDNITKHSIGPMSSQFS